MRPSSPIMENSHEAGGNWGKFLRTWTTLFTTTHHNMIIPRTLTLSKDY